MFRQIILTSTLVFSCLVGYAQMKGRPLMAKDTISDPTLQIPEEIERNFDELLVDWNKSFKQSPLCHKTTDDDISYPDSVYIERLYSLPSEMELVYNPIVRSYINMYASRRKSSVEFMLGKSSYYFPMIEEVLDKYGLPLELKYLPIIESALNPVAISRVGATGLWQFMLGTGKMYDLEVNSLVDERRDPSKATEAAARYLKDLHNIYGDWNLVIAAYNCGPGNVNKAIRRSGGQKDYWTIYPYLPRETRGYVPAFIAATYIMNYYSKHNICPLEYDYPKSIDTLMIDKTIHLEQISDMLDISIDKLRNLNPQYKKDIIPGDFKEYALRLPSSTIPAFISNEDTIFAHKANEYLTHRKTIDIGGDDVAASSSRKVHRVRSGENLASIARKYGVSVAQIKKWNNLRSNRVAVGRRLAINTQVVKESSQPIVKEQLAKKENTTPIGSSKEVGMESASSDFISGYYNKNKESDVVESDNKAQESTRKTAANMEDTRTIYHKIRIGENISIVATKYNVTVADITKWNNLSSKRFKVGQRLLIHLPINENIQPTLAEKPEVKKNVAVSSGTQALKVTPMAKTTKKTIYQVKKGDSLYIIAKRFNKVTPKDIMLANNMRNDKLSVGQKLNIPIN